MLRVEVTTNGVEISLSRGDVTLVGVSALLLVVLLIGAGWQIAGVALTLSVTAAAAVAAAQRA
jgi:hypothetical protein